MSAERQADRRYLVLGNALEAPPLAPGLYVVATPIGNLRDITLWALETLAAAELVLCEDTRTSGKLLDHYGIRSPRAPLHERSSAPASKPILARLADGAAIALISDAGTPLLRSGLSAGPRRAGGRPAGIRRAGASAARRARYRRPHRQLHLHGFLPGKSRPARTTLPDSHVPDSRLLQVARR